MIGTSVSHYKILEKLGEGGMGVVYKAQDTKLNRTVALKVLPDRVNKDEGAKARFLQEAQAAAGLNHPNICTVYGVDESAGQLFISMEFVDGGTLRQKIPFAKVNDALTIAVQIGEALHEAHAKGIVHRDIKADNVMVNSKGQTKVMDFGLAKLKGSLKLTRTSSTVGTLGYMAPEQIQGGEVDHRSDVFSFGVLLFEMLSGKLPFRGEHEAAMVYSIVNEQPEPLLSSRPDAPLELIRILGRALEKDPDDRYQSAADMVSELRHLLKQSSRVLRSAANIPIAVPHQDSAAMPVQVVPASQTNWWMMGGGIGVVLLGILGYFVVFKGNNTSETLASLNPEMKLHVLPIPFTEFSYPGISKDGNWVAFPAANANTAWDIYYMHVSGNESRRVTNDSIASGFNLQADISPDGSLIAYEKPNPGSAGIGVDICVMSALGGQSKRIAQDATLPRWRPDAQRIGYVRFGKPSTRATYNLWSVKPDGSDNRPEFSDTVGMGGRFSRYSFNWSPDGRSIAWIRSFQGGYQEVITHDLESAKERQLTFDKKNIDDVAWTKNGFVIFSSNRGGNTNLWIVPVSGGSPQQLTKGSGPDIGISVSANDQRLVYLQQQQVGSVWVSDLKTNASQQITFDDRQVEFLALSPDGKKIAYTMGDIDPLKPGVGLYVQDRNGTNRRQLISEPTGIFSLSWAPDGKRIAISMVRLNQPVDSARIVVMNAADPGEATQLTSAIRATWLDPATLVVTKVAQVDGNFVAHDEIIDVDQTLPPKRIEDSLSIVRGISGNKVLVQDRHYASKGLWIVSRGLLDAPWKDSATKLSVPEGTLSVASYRFLYLLDPQDRLWKIDYVSGKKQQVRGSFSGLSFSNSSLVSQMVFYTTPGWNFAPSMAVSDNDSELSFVAYRYNARLVMIENIFK